MTDLITPYVIPTSQQSSSIWLAIHTTGTLSEVGGDTAKAAAILAVALLALETSRKLLRSRQLLR